MNKRKAKDTSPDISTASYNANEEKAENIIGKRISAARKRANMTQNQFSTCLKKYGITISNAAESKWETGETIPNAYQLMAVCAALGLDDMLRVFSKNSESLLNDEGERKVLEYRKDLVASGKYRPIIKADEKVRYIEMPVSTLAASAGTGAFLDSDYFEKISLPAGNVPQGAEFGIRVSGDSMEPVYHDGQIVWVEQCKRLNIGEVGIFILDGEGFIKSYDEQRPAESLQDDFTDSYGVLHMQPVLVSFNKKYEARPIMPSSDFRLIGRVL